MRTKSVVEDLNDADVEDTGSEDNTSPGDITGMVNMSKVF